MVPDVAEVALASEHYRRPKRQDVLCCPSVVGSKCSREELPADSGVARAD